MVLNIHISSETEAKLKARAKAAGMDLSAYAARQLEQIAGSRDLLVELSGPVREAIKDAGMSEDELSEFLEEEKHAMRRERRDNG